MRAHGVNKAMALKTSAIWSLLSGEPGDRDAILTALEVLDRYHGQPNGMFSADEHYAGRDPSEGTELCAVVEAMFSIEQSLAARGGVALADRLERIAYNALPATLSADMWSHQYDQQANQVLCSLNRRRWVSNGPESNLFGLEPNFGCCTANLHQGWPKLVASLWMASPDDGLAAVAYGPSKVTARVELSSDSRQRDWCVRRGSRRIRTNRSGVASGRSRHDHAADVTNDINLVPRLDCRRAWTAGVRLAGWRRLAAPDHGHEKARALTGGGLGSPSDYCLELRTGARSVRGGAPGGARRRHRRCALRLRNAGGHDWCDRPAHTGMAARGRIFRDSPEESGDQP